MKRYCNIIYNIFKLENNYENPNEKKAKKISRFEYLDGYRGSLAIVVAISHKTYSIKDLNEVWRSTLCYSQTYGVAGFFMLSAYLLSFRFLEELNNIENQPRRNRIILIITKYFIRRFFRIYLVYVIFIIFIKFGPKFLTEMNLFEYKSPFLQMVTLGHAGSNHLWTIPAEIRYYFCIPIFCLIVHYSTQFLRWIFLIACVMWTIYDQMFNFFGLTIAQLKFDYEESHCLYVHFAVFFMGSQVALAYHLISKLKWTKSYFKKYYINLSLDLLSLFIPLFGLHQTWMVFYGSFTFRSRPTIYWSIAFLLTLLSAPNSLSNFFNSSFIFKSVGKYSFSFYLLHSIVCVWPFQHILSPFWTFFAYLLSTYIISFFTFYLIENLLIRYANYLCEKLDNSYLFASYQQLGSVKFLEK